MTQLCCNPTCPSELNTNIRASKCGELPGFGHHLFLFPWSPPFPGWHQFSCAPPHAWLWVKQISCYLFFNTLWGRKRDTIIRREVLEPESLDSFQSLSYRCVINDSSGGSVSLSGISLLIFEVAQYMPSCSFPTFHITLTIAICKQGHWGS